MQKVERSASAVRRESARNENAPSQNNIVHGCHDDSHEVGIDRSGIIGVCGSQGKGHRKFSSALRLKQLMLLARTYFLALRSIQSREPRLEVFARGVVVRVVACA